MDNVIDLRRSVIEVRKTYTSGEELLQAALSHIEVESVREWATNSHNRPILVQIAEGILTKNNNSYSDLRFATWMVCEAMGL